LPRLKLVPAKAGIQKPIRNDGFFFNLYEGIIIVYLIFLTMGEGGSDAGC